jgi:hypothetical protein
MHVEGQDDLKPSGHANPGGEPGQPQTKVNLNDAEDIMCEAEGCGCKVFEEKIILKKVSKFLTGAAQDQVTPVPVVVCAACNHINEMFIPKF